jgi:hypothetical protein
LILSRRSNLALDGQVGKKGFDFWSAHFCWVTLVMEEDVTFDPIEITSFGAKRVVFSADSIPDLVEQLWFRHFSPCVE